MQPLQPPVTSSLLDWNILLSTLFPNTLTLYSSVSETKFIVIQKQRQSYGFYGFYGFYNLILRL
jgi:hypothetical protein